MLIASGVGVLISIVLIWKRCSWIAVALTLLTLMPVTIAYVGGVSALSAAYVVMVGTGLALCVQYRAQLSRVIPPLLLGALVFVVWPVIWADASIADQLVAARPLLAATSLSVGLFAMGATDPERFRGSLVPMIWSAVPMAGLAIYQRLVGMWPILDELALSTTYTSASYANRAAGTMGHPIILGIVAGAISILAITQRPRWWPVPFSAALVCIALSGSRSGLLGLVAGLTVVALHRRSPSYRHLIPGLLIAATAILASMAVWPGWLSRLTQEFYNRLNIGTDESGAMRTARLDLAWQYISQAPEFIIVGRGPNADVTLLAGTSLGLDGAITFDSTYIIVWFNYGLIGLSVLAVGIALAITRSRFQARALIAMVAVEAAFFDIRSWPAMLTIVSISVGMIAVRDQSSLNPDLKQARQYRIAPTNIPSRH